MGRQWLHAKRAIVNLKKGQVVGTRTGTGGDKSSLDHVVYEGYAPHKVPVIVEVYTDNHQRTAPEIRVLFKKGVLGSAHSNKFLFDHVGIVEAYTTAAGADLEAVAIEAGANDFSPLTHAQNDDVPEGAHGVHLVTDRTAVHAVSVWLKEHGWHVITSEIGYVAKTFPELDDAGRAEVGEFLQELEDHDDVQRVWAAVK
jgi:transcriptional/translational regulatory protein YebC/TACO1